MSRLSLFDNKEALKACREELRNWGRWSRDDDERHLDYKSPQTFRYYVNPMKAAEPEPVREPIDALEAEKVEARIVALRKLSMLTFKLLVWRYIYGLSYTEVGRREGISKYAAASSVEAAEASYWDYKIKRYERSLPWG